MVNGNSIDKIDLITKSAELINNGRQNYDKGNYEDSISYFRKAIECWPDDLEAWVRLSLACVKLALINKSDSLFSEAFVSAQRAIKHIFELHCDIMEYKGLRNGYEAANYVMGICYIEYFGDRSNAIKKYELLNQMGSKFAGRLREIIFKGDK